MMLKFHVQFICFKWQNQPPSQVGIRQPECKWQGFQLHNGLAFFCEGSTPAANWPRQHFASKTRVPGEEPSRQYQAATLCFTRASRPSSWPEVHGLSASLLGIFRAQTVAMTTHGKGLGKPCTQLPLPREVSPDTMKRMADDWEIWKQQRRFPWIQSQPSTHTARRGGAHRERLFV